MAKNFAYIVDSKYRKLVEVIIEVRSFKIEDIINKVDYSLSTIYRYLNDLVDLGILSKVRYKRYVRFRLKIKKEKILELIKNYSFENWFSIFLMECFPIDVSKFR